MNRVILDQEGLDEIESWCRCYPDVEVCGYLIGERFEDNYVVQAVTGPGENPLLQGMHCAPDVQSLHSELVHYAGEHGWTYLGEWHKHPGSFGPQPSFGDKQSVQAKLLEDNPGNREILKGRYLSMICTLGEGLNLRAWEMTEDSLEFRSIPWLLAQRVVWYEEPVTAERIRSEQEALLRKGFRLRTVCNGNCIRLRVWFPFRCEVTLQQGFPQSAPLVIIENGWKFECKSPDWEPSSTLSDMLMQLVRMFGRGNKSRIGWPKNRSKSFCR